MIRIGILGDIGAGKSYVAKNFGYPIFDADQEVSKLYKSDQKIFNKLKKKLPKFIYSTPIDKKEITNAILTNKKNLDIIIKIIHFEIRKNFSVLTRKLFFQPQTFRFLAKVLMCLNLLKPHFFQILNFSC